MKIELAFSKINGRLFFYLNEKRDECILFPTDGESKQVWEISYHIDFKCNIEQTPTQIVVKSLKIIGCGWVASVEQLCSMKRQLIKKEKEKE